MAMKCVAQIPYPVAAPVVISHSRRVRPVVAQLRWNRLMAAKLVRKHTAAANSTRRQSCCVVRQEMTRNIRAVLRQRICNLARRWFHAS